MRRACGHLAAATAGGLYLWLAAAPILAQPPNKPVSTAKPLPPAKPVIEWVIGAVFLVACLVVAFKNAKRSNVQ